MKTSKQVVDERLMKWAHEGRLFEMLEFVTGIENIEQRMSELEDSHAFLDQVWEQFNVELMRKTGHTEDEVTEARKKAFCAATQKTSDEN